MAGYSDTAMSCVIQNDCFVKSNQQFKHGGSVPLSIPVRHASE